MRLFRAAAAGAICAAMVAGSASAQGLLRDEEIERMLRAYSDPIFVAADLQPRAVTIYLVGDPTMNAFVAGGQNIFIHTGIIVQAEEPIELKGVIAHETGHITGAHLSRSGDLSRAAMGPFLATMAAGIAAAVAGHGDAAANLMIQSQYFGTLGAFSYSRGQEARADLAGVQFLEGTGQSARGLIAFFDRFREQELFSEQRRYPYFRTHPLSSDRVSVLRERLDQQVYRDAVDPPEHVHMLERAKAKIHGFLDTPQTTFRQFPESDQSTEAIYARSIAHYRAGSLGQAIAGIDELISREPENPYFWELKGQVFYEHGRPASAVEPYERAVALMPDSALFKIGLAQSLIDLDDDARLDEAMELLITALTQEPDNGFAWYQRSRVHERRGERAMALLSTAERHYLGGDPRRAFQFAARARDDLEQGTPEWLRATDIVSTIAAANGIDPDDVRER
jgi:predicted Zn-dependent protease